MSNKLITCRAVQADTIYRAGSTVVNVRPERVDNIGEIGATGIFTYIPEAVVCHDNKMNIVWANDYACQLFGVPGEQIKTGKCYEMLCKKQSHCAGCPVLRTLETGVEYEARINADEGNVIFVRSYPLKDENGCINGIVEVVKDISGRSHHQHITDKASCLSAADYRN